MAPGRGGALFAGDKMYEVSLDLRCLWEDFLGDKTSGLADREIYVPECVSYDSILNLHVNRLKPTIARVTYMDETRSTSHSTPSQLHKLAKLSVRQDAGQPRV